MAIKHQHFGFLVIAAIAGFACCGCGGDDKATQSLPAPVKVAKVPTPRPTLKPTPTPAPSRAEIRSRERAARREARRKKREEAKRMAEAKEREEAAKGRARKYTISKREDSSISGITRYTVRVVVPEDIRAVDVRPTAEKIIAQLRAEDPEIDELGLFLYKREPAEGIYDVASVDWAPNGEWGSTTSDVAESNDRSSYSINVQAASNLP